MLTQRLPIRKNPRRSPLAIHSQPNRHLDRFAVGFRIYRTLAEFPRGLPVSSYQIVINSIPTDLGVENMGHDVPSFNNTLSEATAAPWLCRYLWRSSKATAPPGIVVNIEGPFQSQDATRTQVCWTEV
jgi:hypothetical protein